MNRRQSLTRTRMDTEDHIQVAMINGHLWAQAHVTWARSEKWLRERNLINNDSEDDKDS